LYNSIGHVAMTAGVLA